MSALSIFYIFVIMILFGYVQNGFCYISDMQQRSRHSSKTDSYPQLEPIGDSKNFRMIGKNGKEEKSWFEGREVNVYCVRQTSCVQLENSTCLGSNIPYSSTSLSLTDSYSQRETLEKLNAFNALRYVPKCWAVIQPFLCSLYMPKCEKIENREMVYLPSLNMCKIVMDACRLFNNTSYFPEFFRCDEKLYPPNCNNDVREMKFNVTGQCLKPLVPAESSSNFYKDIDGCGMQCKNPLYTDDEHQQIHRLIGWGSSICLGFNIFAVLTFLIDWKNASKYPALVIFYINFCYIMSCAGWLAQFTPGGREDIVCRRDGTQRHSEPSAGENLSCIVVFVLVYYFLIAAMVWFAIFTYTWYMSFRAMGKIQDRIDKKGSYFHLIAWSSPLVLTITIMALSEVDGSSITGICFVGYINHEMRTIMLLGPVCIVLLIGGFFLSRGMLTLIQLKITSKEIISARASKKIKETIVRMGLCTLSIFVIILTTIVCHINEFKHSNEWNESLRKYIICKISTSYSDSSNPCKLDSRPSVAMLQLHLLCFFASGIIMSSWVWTHSSLETWGRYIRRKFGCDVDEPVKLQKHKLIAQAFAKRKEFQNQGRLSISFHNSHTDPVGLNFDLNSVASHDFSSTWANNLPRFVNRRCALTGAATSSSHGIRRNSVDSEISFSVRHVSVESRRNSIDSQVSVKIAEMKTKVASRRRSGSGSKGKHRHRKRDFTNSHKFFRRESSTSIESQIISALRKSKYTDKSGSLFHGAVPHNSSLKRRSANAGLDAEQINALISNGKLIFPFLKNRDMTTSDEDNVSMQSFKVKDSKLDVILKQVTGCEESDAGITLTKGCKIQEYNTTDDEKMNLKSSNKGYLSINDILNQSNDDDENISSMRNSKEAGRVSKNSVKSTKSRRSSKQGTRRNRKNSKNLLKSSKNEKLEKDLEFDDSSFSSFCSELAPPNVQSSYSGVSMGKNHSRNSKRSCDVGVQTNSHEIATQTVSSYKNDDGDDEEIINTSAVQRIEQHNENSDEDEFTESHLLLSHLKKEIVTRKREDSLVSNNNISEAEKLKLLLLPSK